MKRNSRVSWIYGLVFGALVLAAAAEAASIWYLQQPSCPFKKQAAEISGGSLEPLVKSGTRLTLLGGYYDCRPVRRGDLVAFRYGGNKDPLVKLARGIPGDTLALEPESGGVWHILVNGETLENSAGHPYIVNGRQKLLFDQYLQDYHGVLPGDTYLLLGDLTEGSRDSRDFGWVAKADVIGKVQ